MSKLIRSGLIVLASPFLIMALEYLWAIVSGATGENLAAAGFWGLMLVYILAPVGALLLGLGLLGKLLQR